jgi:hypothetical protein
MTLDEFLSRLDGVKKLPQGEWVARCPAHDDHSPSLNITEKSDGRLVYICRAGCPQVNVVEALGLTFSDLFPEKYLGHHKPIKRRWSPRAICEIMGASASNLALLCERKKHQDLTEEESATFDANLQNIILLSHEALYG